MSSFRENLIQLMAVQNLALTPLDGLEGAELVEAQENNEGLTQLADAITQLHERLLNSAIAEKPKTAAAKKPKTATAADADAEETKPKKPRAARKPKEPKPVVEGEEATKKRAARKPKEPKPVVEGEEAPKKRAARKPKEPKPVVEGEGEVNEEPKKKRAANAQAVFARLVSQAHKGEMAGWDAIKLTVSLAKVTEKGQVMLDTPEGKEFVGLKGTDVSLAALLQRAQQLITAVDGKVNLMKLTGLMWSAVGNQIPAQLQQQ
jgi:hypothetical protein